MNAYDQPATVQTNVPTVNAQDNPANSDMRQVWQTPEATHLEIKRTMNTSGIFTDGPTTSHNTPV